MLKLNFLPFLLLLIFFLIPGFSHAYSETEDFESFPIGPFGDAGYELIGEYGTWYNNTGTYQHDPEIIYNSSYGYKALYSTSSPIYYDLHSTAPHEFQSVTFKLKSLIDGYLTDTTTGMGFGSSISNEVGNVTSGVSIYLRRDQFDTNTWKITGFGGSDDYGTVSGLTEWSDVDFEFNFVEGTQRVRIGDSGWINFPNFDLANSLVRVKQVFFDGGVSAWYPIGYLIDNVTVSDTPLSSDIIDVPACGVHANYFLENSYSTISTFDGSEPHSYVAQFTPSEYCSFNKVEATIRFSGGYDDWMSVRVYEMATSTGVIDNSTYLDTSLYTVDVNGDGTTPTIFDFVSPINFIAGHHYALHFKAFDEFDVALNNNIEIMGYKFDNPYGIDLNKHDSYTNGGTYISTGSYEPTISLLKSVSGVSTIVLDSPCVTNTEEYLIGGCTFGVIDTDSMPSIPVAGLSTSYQSWEHGSYQVSAKLWRSDGVLIDSQFYEVPDPLIPYNFDWQLFPDSVAEPDIIVLEVCQQALYSSWFQGYGNCAVVYIGWGLSDAETVIALEELGWVSDSGLIEAIPIFIDSCVFESWDDYLNVYKGAKCALIWAFIPSNLSLTEFLEVKDVVLRSYPIGYATFIIEDITGAVTSTSTDALDREIEIGKYFGMPNTATTTLDFDSMFQYTSIVTPITDYIDIMLWIGFASWFLIWALTRKL